MSPTGEWGAGSFSVPTDEPTFTVLYDDQWVDGTSLRAWGLYAYLRRMPPGWEARLYDLVQHVKEGRDALVASRDELVAAGLLRREDYLDGGLRRTRYVLVGRDARLRGRAGATPGNPPRPEAPADEEGAQTSRSAPDPGNPVPGAASAGFPDPGNPAPGNPDPGNPSRSKERGTKDGTTKERSTAAPPSASRRRAPVRERAGRLPEDWRPPADVWETIKAECSDVDLQAEHLIFTDYWHGKSGQDATKQDWTSTWRVWMRREQKAAARQDSRRRADVPSVTDRKLAKARAAMAELNAETAAHPQQLALPGGTP